MCWIIIATSHSIVNPWIGCIERLWVRFEQLQQRDVASKEFSWSFSGWCTVCICIPSLLITNYVRTESNEMVWSGISKPWDAARYIVVDQTQLRRIFFRIIINSLFFQSFSHSTAKTSLSSPGYSASPWVVLRFTFNALEISTYYEHRRFAIRLGWPKVCSGRECKLPKS